MIVNLQVQCKSSSMGRGGISASRACGACVQSPVADAEVKIPTEQGAVAEVFAQEMVQEAQQDVLA